MHHHIPKISSEKLIPQTNDFEQIQQEIMNDLKKTSLNNNHHHLYI